MRYLFAAVAVLGLASVGRGDQIAFEFTGGKTAGYDPEVGNNAGYSFTVHSIIAVTSLGFTDLAPAIDTLDHPVGIWDADAQLVVSATVFANSTLFGQFRFEKLASPVILDPGVYTIGAFYPSGSDIDNSLLWDVTGFFHAPEVSFNSSLDLRGVGFLQLPSIIRDDPLGYFGPNFQFTQPSPIPEPVGIALLSIGLAVLAIPRCRKSRPPTDLVVSAATASCKHPQ